MKTVLNVIWFIIFGWIVSFLMLALGVVCIVSIVFIPFAPKCFTLIPLVAFPFGKSVYMDIDTNPVMNVLWAFVIGLEMCVFFVSFGILFMISIVGIPFGIACFKIVRPMFFPYGATVEND